MLPTFPVVDLKLKFLMVQVISASTSVPSVSQLMGLSGSSDETKCKFLAIAAIYIKINENYRLHNIAREFQYNLCRPNSTTIRIQMKKVLNPDCVVIFTFYYSEKEKIGDRLNAVVLTAATGWCVLQLIVALWDTVEWVRQMPTDTM